MQRLAGQASLAEEVAGIQYGDDPLLALLGDDRQLDLALLDVEDAVGGISLPEDALVRLDISWWIGRRQPMSGRRPHRTGTVRPAPGLDRPGLSRRLVS